jgi:hypothetical protein
MANCRNQEDAHTGFMPRSRPLLLAILAAALCWPQSALAAAPVVSNLTLSPDNGFGQSGTGAVTFTWDSDQSATFTCSIDGGVFDPCGGPALAGSLTPLLGLLEGAHTVDVSADNGVDPPNPPASLAFLIDLTNPVVSVTSSSPADGQHTNLVLGPSSSSYAYNVTDPLSGSPPVASGVASAVCNADRPAPLPDLPYCDLSNAEMSAEGLYTMTFTGTDNVGHVGTATRTFTVDTTDPVLSGLTMTPEHTSGFTNSQTPTFTWSEDEPTTPTCSMDLVPVACSSPFTPTPLSLGLHIFKVSAIDQAGNPSNQLTKSFEIDRTRPTFFYGALSPQHGASTAATKQTSTSFSIVNSETLDGSGRSCSLDLGAPAACNGAFSAAGLAAGEHTVDVAGTDLAGNASSGQKHKFFVDLTDPTATTVNTGPPQPFDNDTTPSFTFIATDPGVSSVPGYGPLGYECKIEDSLGPPQSFGPCGTTGSYTSGPLSDGVKTFTVRAIDPAGNNGGAVGTYTWTLDSIPPVAHVDTPWVNGRFSYFEGVPSSYFCTDNVSGVATCDGPVPSGQDVPHARPGGNPESDPRDFAVSMTDNAGNATIAHIPYTTETFQQMERDDAPLAYFRLDDPMGAGTMADFSTHGIAGEYKNGNDSSPDGISGDDDTARYFFGADGYGYANGITAPHGASTMIAWVKFADVRDSQVLDHGDDNAIYLENARFAYRHMGTVISDARVGSQYDVVADQWYMVVARWGGGKMNLFVTPYDAARPKPGPFLAATGRSGRMPTASSTFYIGYGQDKPWLKGWVDEVSYFDRALSDLHLKELWYADPPARGHGAAPTAPATHAHAKVKALTRQLAKANARLRSLLRHHATKKKVAAQRRAVARLKQQLAAAKRRV